MKMFTGQHTRLVLVLFIFFSVCSSIDIFGMSEGEAHRSAWFDFLGKTFNFVILFGFIFLLIRKSLINFLKGRGDKIKERIESSENLKKEAEERLRSIERRLERIREEIKGMKKKAEEEGIEEKKKLLKEAEVEREKILRSVKKEIETHAKKAMDELKEYGSQLSIALAEEKMKKTLDKDQQEKIITKVLEDLKEI
ncbi:MAG: F0F1 ATP synthase subunit B [Acidobacteriota bacterium]